MLEIKQISKSYKTGDFVQSALKDFSLKFRKNEFVAILGPSGSGKTTLLNIIGGLDRYDSGDLIINNKSTKEFKEVEWDSYRNNCIGFVFQSYNLISHISILQNVEMAMTLSGVSKSKKRKKALKVLEKVGLKDHSHKRPNQLSGGQMQRVAIARALANDPDIILADEPTGALDSETSVQIMDLIKEIAKDKLVIMVTHNPELANTYANRIVSMKDGEIVKDTNPINKDDKSDEKLKIKKTAMGFITALNLSFNNIRTKKGRTSLTAFAASIGIIGIALILSLSNGFQIEIDDFERQTVTGMPIMIQRASMNMNAMMNHTHDEDEREAFPKRKVLFPTENVMLQMIHQNNITDEYIEYLKNIDPKLISGINFERNTAINMVTDTPDGYSVVSFDSLRTFSFSEMPRKLEGQKNFVIADWYDVLIGKIPEAKEEMLLVVNKTNSIDKEVLRTLGFDPDKDEIKFEDILNKEFKIVPNNDFYSEFMGHFVPNQDFEEMFNSKDALTVRIAGIARTREDKESFDTFTNSGIFYTNELTNWVMDVNSDSNIVRAQEESEVNILTGQAFRDEDAAVTMMDMFTGSMTKTDMLGFLGKDVTPSTINIFPNDFETKEKLRTYLDAFNKGRDEEDKIMYTDQAEMIFNLSSGIMNGVTAVLIAFSAISLVVSSIMIAIITYISVLERTKEIGILRALGARKKDVKRVFTAETFIIGFASGVLGIVIAKLLTIPANIIIENVSGLANVAKLNPLHALALIIISIILTVISGAIPSSIASRKDPVEALRTE